jgi:hypothetical protein
MLPTDVIDRLRSDFPSGDEYDLATYVLTDLAEKFDPRIVRCVLHLADGDLDRLGDADNLARLDCKALVVSAEYDSNKGERIHDFSKPFGDDAPDHGMSTPYLNGALKAFKKRLKLYRLDAESRIGGHGLSSGKSSGIIAIQPPDTYPQEVWDKLVELNRLRVVNGNYEIVE